MNLFEMIKKHSLVKESDSDFDVEGLADRLDQLGANMDPYEYADVNGSYQPSEDSYQAMLDALYRNPEAILKDLETYDVIDWEDVIATEYKEVIEDLKKWISIYKSKNESEHSKDYLDGDKVNYFCNEYYKHEDTSHRWTKKEMKDWILDDQKYCKSKGYDCLFTLEHLDNLLDLQHDLYKADKKEGLVENQFAPTDEDWDDINHWYNDNYEEMWDKQAKNSLLTSEDIEWLSNQNHVTPLTELSMNYHATGDIETDERKLYDIASNYFYNTVGIYNDNIDKLCDKWAHDQAQKINGAASSFKPFFESFQSNNVYVDYGGYSIYSQLDSNGKDLYCEVHTKDSNGDVDTDNLIDHFVLHHEDFNNASEKDIEKAMLDYVKSNIKNYKKNESDGLTNRTQRLIPTGLNDKKSIDIINSVVGQLSDGIWENTSGMERYWKFTGGADNKGNIIVYDGYDSSKVYKGINRYGVPKHDTKWFYSAFQGKSDDEIKKYFAHKIKQIVKEEGLDWDRNNTDVCSYLDRGSGVTVRDAYKLYDKLLGRIDRITESIQMNKYLITLNFGDKKNNVKVVLTTSANEEGAKKQVCDYFNVPVSAVVKVEDKGSAIKESETSKGITYLDGDTILDELGSEYECVSAMYDELGINTDEEFFPEMIVDDADNSRLYLRSVNGNSEWVLSKNGKTVVCAGRDSANIPIVYFDNEVVKESEDEFEDSNYKVDTSNLCLTNGGWNNNSDIIYGRVKLSSKKNSLPPGGQYDVIYFCENGDLYLYEIGSDVQGAVKWLYAMDGTNEDKWIKWDGSRVQLKNFWNILCDDSLKDEPNVKRESIEAAINKAYFEEEPFPLSKVNYQ